MHGVELTTIADHQVACPLLCRVHPHTQPLFVPRMLDSTFLVFASGVSVAKDELGKSAASLEIRSDGLGGEASEHAATVRYLLITMTRV